MFLHEAGNYFLLGGTLTGGRTASCLLHSLGLICGFALGIVAYKRRVFDKAWLLPLLMALQGICAAAFYADLIWKFFPQLMLLCQYLTALTAALGLLGLMRIAWGTTANHFAVAVLVCIAAPAALTYLPFAFALRTDSVNPPFFLHLGVAFLAFASTTTAAKLAYGSPPPRAQASTEDAKTNAIEIGNSQLLLFTCIASYGLASGIFHAIPLGLPLPPLTRSLPLFLGLCCALGLIWVTFRKNWTPSPSSFWSILTRTVFPLAIMSSILVPLTFTLGPELPVFFASAASAFFEALLAIGCYSVWTRTKIAGWKVFGNAMILYFTGSMLGTMIGAIGYDSIMANETNLTFITVFVFMLLFFVTFMTKSERYAKTIWELLPRETPREFRENRAADRCAQLASEYNLTDRELEILQMLACGKRAGEISDILVVSVNTTRTHIKSIYAKLGVHSVRELLALTNID